MTSKISIRSLISTLGLFCAQTAFGGAIDVELAVGKNDYSVGEKMAITVVYRNNSDGVVRILPEPELYEATTFVVRARGTNMLATTVRFSHLMSDQAALSEDSIPLNPGQAHTRHFRVRVQRSGSDAQAMLLRFRFSGILLPQPGHYVVAASYDTRDHPAAEFTSKPKLWKGKALSNPIVVSFRTGSD